MAKCPKCNGTQIETFPEGWFTLAKRCERCFKSCLKCGGDGVIFTKDEAGREYQEACSCKEIDFKIQLFSQAEIPAQFFDCTLNNFQTLGNDSLAEALHMAKASPKNFSKGHWKGLLFMGGVGVGKTRLVSSLLREYTLNYGISCLFREFTALLSEVKSGYDKGISEAQILDRLSKVEILVIDELGKGRKSDWEIQIEDQIISLRYNMQKTTYFTTNYTNKKSTSYQDASPLKSETIKVETLKERVMGRVYSRLQEMSDFVVIEANDYRQGN